MFHRRQTNHEINMLHERALRIVYNDSVIFSRFAKQKNYSSTIHHQNIQSLTTEVYKNLNYLLEVSFKGLFT